MLSYKKRFGLSAHCLPLSLDEMLRAAQHCGIENIEPDAAAAPFAEFLDGTAFDAVAAEELRERLASHSVAVTSLMYRINPIDPDKRLRSRSIERFMNMIRYAKILGAEMICTDVGRAETVSAAMSDDTYRLLLDELCPIVSRAECQGVTVAFELSESSILYSEERAAQFISDLGSERIGFFADSDRLLSPDSAQTPAQRLIASNICAVRLHGFPTELTAAKLGRFFDFKAETNSALSVIFDGIAAAGFTAAAEYIEKYIGARSARF